MDTAFQFPTRHPIRVSTPDDEVSGTWEIFNQSIAAGQTYPHKIPLGASNYTRGRICGYIPNSIGGNYGRQHFDIICTTVLNDAYSRATSVSFLNVYGYPTPDWKVQGYYYADDNKLAQDGVFQTSTAGNNRLLSCQINGSDLETSFKNTHISIPSYLTMKGHYSAKR